MRRSRGHRADINVRGYELTAWFLALASILALPVLGEAQELKRVGLDIDNDFFLTFNPRRGTDFEYTHGTRIWAEWSGAHGPLEPLAAALLDCDSREDGCRGRIEFGQEIYTPRREASYRAIPGERPHAGWLYLSAGARATDENASTEYRLTAGVIGPPALAEEFQQAIHTILDFREPRGWEYQLPFEPGVQLHLGREVWPVTRNGGLSTFSLGYSGAIDVGTVLTQARADVRARLCFGVLTCGAAGDLDSGGYGVVLRGRLGPSGVFRNAFLDGTLLHDSHAVEKKALVLHARAGVAIQLGHVGLTYAITARTQEYRTEPDGFSYGAIRLSYTP